MVQAEHPELWRSGTGRVIRVGGLVYRGTSDSILFRVHRIDVFPDRVEISATHANGRKKGSWRALLIDDLHEVRREVEVK